MYLLEQLDVFVMKTQGVEEFMWGGDGNTLVQLNVIYRAWKKQWWLRLYLYGDGFHTTPFTAFHGIQDLSTKQL